MLKIMPTRWLMLAVASVFAAPCAASATEWFVAVGGTGSGTHAAPLGRIQDGLRWASPGDVITVRGGVYREALRTIRGGTADAPIAVRGERPDAPVLITTHGTVLRIDHPYIVVENVTLDGQYADAVAVDINSGGRGFVLRRVEVRRSGRDCIDLDGGDAGLIESSVVHHCLRWAGARLDAHGIAAGAVRGLVVRDTEIHTFSGDGIQVDPARRLPSWNDLLVDGCRIWLAPLDQAQNGFPAGRITGENAIDTKAPDEGPRARLVVRNTTAWGFRGAIENQAAFNIKENVEALFDGVTVSTSNIAFRVRGPGTRRGAWVDVQNSVVHSVDVAVRYEDNIERLQIWNSTFGLAVTQSLKAANSVATGLDVRNLLVIGGSPPAEAVDRSNLAVSQAAFVNAWAHDYHLAGDSPAIDTGRRLDQVRFDRDGRRRPQGASHDVGAYERAATPDDRSGALRPRQSVR
jgi:hypothetical protein